MIFYKRGVERASKWEGDAQMLLSCDITVSVLIMKESLNTVQYHLRSFDLRATPTSKKENIHSWVHWATPFAFPTPPVDD